MKAEKAKLKNENQHENIVYPKHISAEHKESPNVRKVPKVEKWRLVQDCEENLVSKKMTVDSNNEDEMISFIDAHIVDSQSEVAGAILLSHLVTPLCANSRLSKFSGVYFFRLPKTPNSSSDQFTT